MFSRVARERERRSSFLIRRYGWHFLSKASHSGAGGPFRVYILQSRCTQLQLSLVTMEPWYHADKDGRGSLEKIVAISSMDIHVAC